MKAIDAVTPEGGTPEVETLAFIGSAGIPNLYGGFESFLEHCAPVMARDVNVCVTCDARLYPEPAPDHQGVSCLYVKVPANGAASIVHDLVAFFSVLPRSTAIVVLGVSGGPWFPLFRAICSLTGRRLAVNIDGVEWRRAKHSRWRRLLLRCFDALAQACSHAIVYDNPGLLPFVLPRFRKKARFIPYSGDHVLASRSPWTREPDTALTICRIEPENSVELMIEGALASSLRRYTVVGNWSASSYGRDLRAKYAGVERLHLCDPVYDPAVLDRLRGSCAVYLHGHSVGGTNPSLVEMLFYDCRILCFDCSFNRHTAGERAEYFNSAGELAAKLGVPQRGARPLDGGVLAAYSARAVSNQYLDLCLGERRRRRRHNELLAGSAKPLADRAAFRQANEPSDPEQQQPPP